MSPNLPLIAPTSMPIASALTGIYADPDLADAYSVTLGASCDTDPERLARFIFSNQPSWVGKLMVVRDTIVARFGLKTADQLTSSAGDISTEQPPRVGIFKIYSRNECEIILGEDDSHLDFRLSLWVEPMELGQHRLVLSTKVQCHNRLGRAYIFVIAPFHRQVVQACLRRAARIGWPH